MAPLWYALHVKARFEKLVEAQLQRKGYEVFSPSYSSFQQEPDVSKRLSFPLFPSYVFCRFSFEERFPVLMTAGVNGVVGRGHIPPSVAEEEIAAIHRVLNSGVKVQPCAYLEEGEQISLEEGPLQGLSGLVVRVKGTERLLLSITLLKRSISFEIDRAWVPAEKERPMHKSA